MAAIPPKPLLVLARFEGDDELHWFIRRPDGTYDEWPPTDARSHAISYRAIEPHRLIPASTDFEVNRGENAAIVEIQNARNNHARKG